jgi:hypothetical protein
LVALELEEQVGNAPDFKDGTEIIFRARKEKS